MNGTQANAGFTLIEVLVAFAIATTLLGLLFRIHSNAAATVMSAEEYLVATELAQSWIQELAETETALSFSRSGTLDKYDWAVRSQEYFLEREANDEHALPYRLRDVTAVVSWPSRDRQRRVELRTLKPVFSTAEQ